MKKQIALFLVLLFPFLSLTGCKKQSRVSSIPCLPGVEWGQSPEEVTAGLGGYHPNEGTR